MYIGKTDNGYPMSFIAIALQHAQAIGTDGRGGGGDGTNKNEADGIVAFHDEVTPASGTVGQPSSRASVPRF
jgi:hypothetical protein